jgi:MFS family permease
MAADGTGTRAVNGRAAVAVLIYLGFTLQLLLAGVVPLVPTIGRSLRLTPAAASWLVTAALLSGAVALAVLTRLADLYGKKAAILVALVLVLAGCLIDAVTDNVGLLLVGRVLMGAQLPMLALPEAIASDTMPVRRGRFTIAAIHAGTGVGIGAGIVLGAVIGLHPAAWHWFFWVGALTTVLGLVATVLFVRDSPVRAPGRLDVPGAVILALALVALLLGLSEGPTWGWASPAVLGLLAGGVLLLAAWWWQAHRARYPLIRPADLLKPEVRLPYAMTFLIAFGVFGSLAAVTRLAQTPAASGFGWGWHTGQTAWFAVPQVAGAVVGIVVLQTLARRIGYPRAATMGVLLNVLAFVGFAVLHGTPNAVLASQGVFSMGTAIGLATTQIIVLAVVPASESGIALGISIVAYAVGNSLGSDVVGVLFASMTGPTGLPALSAYVTGFWICAAVALLAAALSLPLWRRRLAAPPDPAPTTAAA